MGSFEGKPRSFQSNDVIHRILVPIGRKVSFKSMHRLFVNATGDSTLLVFHPTGVKKLVFHPTDVTNSVCTQSTQYVHMQGTGTGSRVVGPPPRGDMGPVVSVESDVLLIWFLV